MSKVYRQNSLEQLSKSGLPPTPTTPTFIKESEEHRRSVYGACPECDTPNSGYGWCGPCIHHNYQQTYPDRTSGNDIVDTFISKSQIISTSQYNFIEWIPHNCFYDLETLAQGGFGSIQSATWIEGPISQFDNGQDMFVRDGAKKVVLKTVQNSKEITPEFFDEIAGSLRHTFRYPILPCYGITQDPESEDFVMVAHFATDGNLRQYMRKNFQNIDWHGKLDILHDLAKGLQLIHGFGYVHRNFHSGNILRDGNASFISDFGLSLHRSSSLSSIFGVLPFVAPEALQGGEQTAAADIYGFGMVMYELATGIPPFHNRPHDDRLAADICRNTRPKIPENVPKLYRELMAKCWDPEPSRRPLAAQLERTLQRWYSDVSDDDEKETCVQFKNADENRGEDGYPDVEIHPEAVYTSRLLQFRGLNESPPDSGYSES